jgi:hypothetical protein
VQFSRRYCVPFGRRFCDEHIYIHTYIQTNIRTLHYIIRFWLNYDILFLYVFKFIANCSTDLNVSSLIGGSFMFSHRSFHFSRHLEIGEVAPVGQRLQRSPDALGTHGLHARPARPIVAGHAPARNAPSRRIHHQRTAEHTQHGGVGQVSNGTNPDLLSIIRLEAKQKFSFDPKQINNRECVLSLKKSYKIPMPWVLALIREMYFFHRGLCRPICNESDSKKSTVKCIL